MNLPEFPDPRRTQSHFCAADARARNRYGDENFRFANVVVIQEIDSAGFEVIDVQSPSANRNGNAELMFLIALAMKRFEGSWIAGHGHLRQQAQHWSGERHQRRRLVKPAPES